MPNPLLDALAMARAVGWARDAIEGSPRKPKDLREIPQLLAAPPTMTSTWNWQAPAVSTGQTDVGLGSTERQMRGIYDTVVEGLKDIPESYRRSLHDVGTFIGANKDPYQASALDWAGAAPLYGSVAFSALRPAIKQAAGRVITNVFNPAGGIDVSTIIKGLKGVAKDPIQAVRDIAHDVPIYRFDELGNWNTSWVNPSSSTSSVSLPRTPNPTELISTDFQEVPYRRMFGLDPRTVYTKGIDYIEDVDKSGRNVLRYFPRSKMYREMADRAIQYEKAPGQVMRGFAMDSKRINRQFDQEIRQLGPNATADQIQVLNDARKSLLDNIEADAQRTFAEVKNNAITMMHDANYELGSFDFMPSRYDPHRWAYSDRWDFKRNPGEEWRNVLDILLDSRSSIGETLRSAGSKAGEYAARDLTEIIADPRWVRGSVDLTRRKYTLPTWYSRTRGTRPGSPLP